MSARPLSAYTSVRTEGALLPADILARIAAGDATFGGLDPASYHLDPSEKIGEATNRAATARTRRGETPVRVRLSWAYQSVGPSTHDPSGYSRNVRGPGSWTCQTV